MSESSNERPLPEDIEQWPTDPQTLLGVESNVSRRDLKLAYVRLIKFYKPEHAPEQFRRLRVAYEELDRELEWREVFRVHYNSPEAGNTSDEPAAAETPPVHIQVTYQDVQGDIDHNVNPKLVVRSQEKAEGTNQKCSDDWWQLAINGGDPTQVYHELRNCVLGRTSIDIDYARLYWLLMLTFEIEPERDPCSWLIEGLRRHGASIQLFEILTVEIRRRKGFVPLILEDGLFDGIETARQIVDLAELRWFAARQQGRFDIISDDFKSLNRRFLDEPDQWLRLMSIGLRQVTLSGASGVMKKFRNELKQIPSTANFNWIWDSLETDMRLHLAWRDPPFGLSGIFDDILRVIETTWESSTAEAREPLLELCEVLTDDHAVRLHDLGQIERTTRPIMQRLLELFDQQLAALNVDRLSELTPALDQELQRFVRKSFAISGQSDFDITVLRFCLHQAVTPYDIELTLRRMPQSVPEQYFVTAEQLTSNLALNVLVQSHRLMWY